ncbi:hypothetical protein EW026_g5566 [Hermanssonia centrifuga]|uniref:Uncharacterized protein n=1 Tax=Hermanssonia centrifuga TaxID=98765 RepID=A0A4S4KDP2_9APHY|nr:hypothetical protein EW026_g5566 [Hermanssonia centrifuga]
MDFMQPAKPDLKDNSNIPRLSRRLQRAERILISQPYDRYAQSPSLRGTPSLNPSTPSSTTLNSDTPGSRPSRLLRRSISSLSNTSDQYQMPVINPSVQRLKRSDTFGGSTLYPTGLKRAPSYGGSSRNSMESVAMSIDFNARDSDVTSSDEEEKLRSQKAKRARRKITSPTPTSPPMSSPMPISPVKPILRSKVVPMTPSDAVKGAQTGKSGKTMQTRLLKPKANLQRNPSILGPELPNPQPNLEPPATIRSSRTTRTPRTLPDTPSRMSVSPPDNRSTVPASPYNLTHIPSISPQSSRTLRRSRAIAPLPRAPLARKISFGSLAAPVEQGRAGSGTGLGLASAFQLH